MLPRLTHQLLLIEQVKTFEITPRTQRGIAGRPSIAQRGRVEQVKGPSKLHPM